MSTFNLRGMADALATQYTGMTATFDGVTEPLQADPSALLPNAVALGPVLLVWTPSGETQIGTSAIRQGEVRFMVRLLRDPNAVPNRTGWLYAWDASMRDRVEQNLDLGMPDQVAEAEVGPFRLEIDGFTYAKVPFDVVEHEVIITVYQVGVTVGA